MPPKTKRPRATPAIRALRQAVLELAEQDDRELSCGDVLNLLSPRFRTLGRSLVWLVAYDQTSLHDRAFSLLHSAFEEPGVDRAVREKVARQVPPMVEKAMDDAGLSDQRKLNLAALLTLAGQPPAPETLARWFDDYLGAVEGMAHSASATLLDTPEQLEGLLRSAGLLDERLRPGDDLDTRVEAALSMGAMTAQANGRVASTLIAISAVLGVQLGYRKQEELCNALGWAAELDSERALALLTQLGRWPHTGAFGDTARALCDQLLASGVKPRPLPVPRFSHGLVSSVDGAGAQSLQLHFAGDEGSWDTIALLLSDDCGLKDLWVSFGVGAQLEEQLRATGIVLAPCDQAFTRSLVADALATNAALGKQLPGLWLLCASFLGPEPILPAVRTPDLGAYLLETVVRGPRQADRSEKLLEASAYDMLGFDADAGYAFVAAEKDQKGRRRKRKRVSQEQRLTAFITVVEPHERDRLLRRLATNLEIEARAGRAQRAINRLAARTWLAMHERLVPFDEVPYVRALAAESLERIAHNLELGYRNQREANQAALDHDQEDFLSDDLFDFGVF